VGTSYVVQSIANHHPSSEGTGWEYEVIWEGWDEKDNTWDSEDIMAKAKVSNGEGVLEGIRRAVKREEKNNTEEGVRSRFLLDCSATLRIHIGI
jgi:hypothetical protein